MILRSPLVLAAIVLFTTSPTVYAGGSLSDTSPNIAEKAKTKNAKEEEDSSTTTNARTESTIKVRKSKVKKNLYSKSDLFILQFPPEP